MTDLIYMELIYGIIYGTELSRPAAGQRDGTPRYCRNGYEVRQDCCAGESYSVKLIQSKLSTELIQSKPIEPE